MPGKRGLETYQEVREIAPNLPVVMVTKSEEDATLREALGANIREYLVKPINPRQVLTVITRILEGPRIRQQAIARRFVERFRAIEVERGRVLDWRGWVDRYIELMQWDVDLAAAGESGLYESLRGLYPDMHREFAEYMRQAYPAWLRDLEGDRPPLSIDIVGEFLLPDAAARAVGGVHRRRLPASRSVAHHRAAAVVDVRGGAHALLRGAADGDAVLAQRAVQRTLSRRDRRAIPRLVGRARGRDAERARARAARGASAGAQLAAAGSLQQDLHGRPTPMSSSATCTARSRREGVSAFVFNFVDLLTHGRSESAILYEVARDEIALRQLTLQWFQRSALLGVLREASRRKVSVLLTSDHGSIHCQTPATVFAKRDATANLRYKFGEDLRAERPEQALLFPNEDLLRLPRRGLGANTLLAVSDGFFVYPTKLREYQSRYRGSFLHGGVTPEECILPVALLTPK